MSVGDFEVVVARVVRKGNTGEVSFDRSPLVRTGTIALATECIAAPDACVQLIIFCEWLALFVGVESQKGGSILFLYNNNVSIIISFDLRHVPFTVHAHGLPVEDDGGGLLVLELNVESIRRNLSQAVWSLYEFAIVCWCGSNYRSFTEWWVERDVFGICPSLGDDGLSAVAVGKDHFVLKDHSLGELCYTFEGHITHGYDGILH